MPSQTSIHLRPLVIFTLSYLLLSAVAAILTANAEFALYFIVMIIMIGVVLMVHRRVSFSLSVLWCLSIWGLLHMMGGMVPIPKSWQLHGPINVLYSFWLIPGILKYDQLIHAYGFGITTWACWQCFRSISKTNLASPGILTLCFFAGMGLGALNEVIEFFATLIIPNTNVGDYNNTGWDLVFNFIGGFIAVIIIGYTYRRKHHHPS